MSGGTSTSSVAGASGKAGGFEHFKRAMQQSRLQLGREHACRAARAEMFDEGVVGASDDRRERAKRRFARVESGRLLAKCRTWNTDALESLQVLGEGAFGVVHLVRCKHDGKTYALKQMEKAAFGKKNREFAFGERDALAEAASRWVVGLYATFQDDKFAYQLMEFLPGGDLVFHLHHRPKLPAKAAAFYTAELLAALEVVHACGVIHRDVKPDNLALGPSGHLKLLDFGYCKRYDVRAWAEAPGGDAASSQRDERLAAGPQPAGGSAAPAAGRYQKASVGGTLEYMAPEVFLEGEVGPDVDIWAAGIIAFECLVGTVPFTMGPRTGQVAFEHMREQMKRHVELLPTRFARTRPKGTTDEVSEQFLTSVLCPRDSRASLRDCRRQPFFEGLDFDRLHESQPPFEPRVCSQTDASYFEQFGQRDLPQSDGSAPSDDWAGYEFDREAHELLHEECVDLELLLASRSSSGSDGSRSSAGSCSVGLSRSPAASAAASAAATGKEAPAKTPSVHDLSLEPSRRAIGGA